MKAQLLKFLQAIRILDLDLTLNLTAVALFVVLFKLALAPVVSFAEVGTLLLALAAQVAKRHQAHQRKVHEDVHASTKVSTALQQDLDATKAALQDVKDKVENHGAVLDAAVNKARNSFL